MPASDHEPVPSAQRTVRAWEPVGEPERYLALDVLRGISLLGVLLVNLLTVFRISLFQHMLTFHTHPGWANRVTDILVAAFLESKSFDLFSLCFGIGVALQAERCGNYGVSSTRFLMRRFLVLFAFGLFHMVVIWNGDILALYAVCGLLLLPFLRLPARWLAVCGAAAIALTLIVPFGYFIPPEEALRAHAAQATRIYAGGSFGEILAFRWQETRQFIAPLLLATLPKVLGIMLLGAAIWRSGVLQQPSAHRRVLRAAAIGAGAAGAAITAVSVYSASAGRPVALPGPIVQMGSDMPLALAYGAALLLWLTPARPVQLALPVAAAGRMALTNYLVQSVVLSLIFYGCGLGLFGRLGPATAALIGLGLFAFQVAASQAWLRRYRFGPFVWLWCSMTYGEWQRISRKRASPV